MLSPGSTIGILGGGQLGRMMAIAAAEMGYNVHIYCPEKDCPASEVAAFTTVGAYDDVKALEKFAGSVDVITYEFENIPSDPIFTIAKVKDIFPSPEILAVSQHRILEKQAVNKMGIATAPFKAVSSHAELLAATKTLGFPCILKTATMGYDGKGQFLLRGPEDFSTQVLDFSSPLILEGFVNFSMEISVIVARGRNGDIKCYTPVQNIHKHHILSETIAPAPISEKLANEAENIAKKIALELGLVGLLAIEMFVTNDEKIIVNEIAPRPHNSGHWTIDACVTSQFEQVIRAVCGLKLGNPARLCDARMLNLIGDDINDWEKYTKTENAKLHLYGKKETKPGRKMGHVTFLGSSE